MVKIGLAQMIYYDNEMFDPVADKPSRSKTSDLIEELGQVEFIFSDKTGTLTQNVMEFKKCAIEEKIFGDREDKDRNVTDFSINGDTTASQILLSTGTEKKGEKKAISSFFRLLAVCHSAVSEKNNDGELKYSVNKYNII